jgi:uncharacterized protein (TIGR02996 family)
MTPDELAFYKSIMADPADDLRRLTFADWLDEHNRSDRAEFIRLQIERNRADPTVAPTEREQQLLAANAADWLREVPPGFRTGAEFVRGFVQRVRVEATGLLISPPPEVIAPIEEMTILVGPLDYSMEGVRPPPLTLPLRSLAIECAPFVGPVLLLYLRLFGPFPRLERLRIQDFMFGDDGARNITPLPSFPMLTALDLSHCGIGDEGAEALAASEWAKQLTELRLTGNHISSNAYSRLRTRFEWALAE